MHGESPFGSQAALAQLNPLAYNPSWRINSMTLSLNLTPELESLIRAAAASTGEDMEAFVLRAVQERIGDEQEATGTIQDDDAWRARFAAWLASHKPVNHFVDDSRESIYSE